MIAGLVFLKDTDEPICLDHSHNQDRSIVKSQSRILLLAPDYQTGAKRRVLDYDLTILGKSTPTMTTKTNKLLVLAKSLQVDKRFFSRLELDLNIRLPRPYPLLSHLCKLLGGRHRSTKRSSAYFVWARSSPLFRGYVF